MQTKASYSKRRYIHIEFDSLPSNYSSLIIRKKKLRDNGREKVEGEGKDSIVYSRMEKMKLRDFMLAVGTVFGMAQGSSCGYLYYNNQEDLQGGYKYHLYCLEESDGSLRIDFLKIAPSSSNSDKPSLKSSAETVESIEKMFPLSENHLNLLRDSGVPSNSACKENLNDSESKPVDSVFFSDFVSNSDFSDPDYQVPSLVFRGSKLEFLTNRKEAFVGVAEFV